MSRESEGQTPPQPPRVWLAVAPHPAAARAPEIALALARRGAAVSVVLAPGAEAFSPITAYEAIQGALGDRPRLLAGGEPLPPAADVVVLAPAHASLSAALRLADSGNPVVRLLLGTKAPLCLVPPFDSATATHPLTIKVLGELQTAGVRVCPPGDHPVEGTLPDPESAARWILDQPACDEKPPSGGVSPLPPPSPTTTESTAPALPARAEGGPWAGKRILITGGPTRETIDGFHFLTTPGSGILALSLAAEALQRGAEVVLCIGIHPLNQHLTPADGLTIHRALSADEMLHRAMEHLENCDGLILADTASTLRAERPYHAPVFRTGNSLSLRMVETPDLAQALAFRAKPGTRATLVQLCPATEIGSPAATLTRRRLAAIATISPIATDGPSPASSTQEPHSPSRDPMSAVSMLAEDHFLQPGHSIRIERNDSPAATIESGHVGRMLDLLMEW